MAGDLPAGKYTAALIGSWWPQPASTLRAGAQHWLALAEQQERYAQSLRNQWTQFASRNQGHTADDLVYRYQKGEKFHLDLAEKYSVKSAALEKAGDAIDNLREGLRGIADEYNQRISAIENSKEPAVTKIAEIQRLIAEANGFAAHKSGAAVAAIMDGTEKILTTEGVGMSAQEFLASQGLTTDGPVKPATGDDGAPGKHGVGVGSHGGSANTGDGGPPGVHGHGETHVATSYVGDGGPAGGRGAGVGSSGPNAPGGAGSSPPVGAPIGAGHMPGAVGVGSQLAGGGLSPAAALGGLSPNQLGHSFAQGVIAGQPAGSGANQLSQGLMSATGAGSAPPPQPPVVPPVSAPTIVGAGVDVAAVDHGSGAPASTASSAPVMSTGGAVPVAAAMPLSTPMTPVTGGPAATPAGPLPVYGSDLRPPVVAPPAVPAPTAPVSGAPVAPSPSTLPPTSPSAGSALMSTVQRGAAEQAGASAASPAGASALSAAAGAAAGDVSSRAAEQQRLQRLVDAVARQAPGLSWAAGLRDDGTTLLVSNVAGGWIPPNVKIPVGVNRLLEPGHRRSDANVVDLLGAVTTAAVHKPHGFIAKPEPDDPALTADRLARTGPEVDELGPALVEAVRRRDGLPRIAQTLAQAATRGTGVTENEVEVLQGEQQAAYQKALEGPHDLSPAADWMLLAAIDALIAGHESVANYHMAWYVAISAKL
ncbi:hypothetical protein BST11_19410 [Mycobacterium alsense]|uniref:DUF5632 domain-containing protein n=1 Tax=Mycobacterium alsense TaxID=324058 RepID=A0AA41XK62_9MYCO|nr:DUF5632 domain-containing protein [Mycobacterium alsense]MCV7377162.1 DUF5632 domain-containing protein [Mycobacterium alsense]OQZ89125.1 hypothetical protein BST11_19410 [Mycobacterium alsense]